jgi:LPS-assembly protein
VRRSAGQPARLMHDVKTKAFHARFALTPVALVACALLQPTGARAQETQPLALKPSTQLREHIPGTQAADLPVFLSGDQVSGRTELETVIQGHAQLRRGETLIRADRLSYDQATDLARARGNVHLNRAGNTYDGTLLELNVDSFAGFFNQPRYRFLRNNAYGEADRVDFIDQDRSVIRNATYTTCQRFPGPSWMPAWILRAASIRIDEEEEVGQASDAVLRFKNVPILALPSVSFPLSERRKSGMLPPTIGVDNLNGFELTTPYYWNIAPNRDATIYPTLMTKRGIDLGGEFRYLEPEYSGQVRANYMPSDQLRNRDRWGIAGRHDGTLFAGSPLGGLGLNLNINRVSDDNYWRDFNRTTATLTQRLLANDGTLSWSRGDLSIFARALKWQVLQDPTAPIVPPYDRLPQVDARYAKNALPGGFEASAEDEYTRFEADGALTGQPNARRNYAIAQISRPWQAPGWFIRPKFMVQTREYQFDAPLANGATSYSSSVPTFSLDSGLVFERNATFFGRNFRQTLEPRAFYVYTPYREQNLLPVYDTALHDFNFASIYTENEFAGHDRISASDLLTVGASTRLIDADSGAEAAKFGIAQRLRFKDQDVTLPGGTPVSERLSDMLFGATINWTPKWSLDSLVQFNPKTRQSIRSTIEARYSPGNYRTVSAAYRVQRGESEQIDVGWQWPLADLWGRKPVDLGPGQGEGEGRWYSVGRLNLSLKDRRVVDSIFGFEYDGGCWVGRIVVERMQSSTNTSNKRILFQLELEGLTRLGTNALERLSQSIPRYQLLREEVRPPSRFTNYE